MSLHHKAFVFDYRRFNVELAPALLRALEIRSSDELRRLINSNLESFRDPYEGEPLTRDWEARLKFGNEHEVGDFALTKFYSPVLNFGLGSDWMDVDRALVSLGEGLGLTLLGTPFGPPENPFDPGRTGSYFQSPEDVVRNLSDLRRARRTTAVERAEAILKKAVGYGLYATF